LSQIGHLIDQPLVASIQVLPKEEIHLSEISRDIEGVIDSGLANITCITEKIIRGEVRTF
ncbi:MAG TPA: methionine adenosyltransferase, partial [Methanoregulaceae archaeon]|nr:methionine adenosyltransferase [Methanoregulaceae archaeon]